MTNNKITKLDLHLKDYGTVREDVDEVQDWFKWTARIVAGVLILGLLALIGLK